MAELLPRMEELFGRLFADTRATMPLPHLPLTLEEAVSAVDHLSMQDRLDTSDLTPEERDLANAVLSTSCSARCSEAALTAMMRWYALPGWSFGLMLDAVGVYPLRTADLVHALLADGEPDVRTGTPVQAVEQQSDRVRVRTRTGEEFTAAAAVVAVPLNTLGSVDFSPPLDPAKQSAASQGQASHGVKLWARVHDAPDGRPPAAAHERRGGPPCVRGHAARHVPGRGGDRPRLVCRRVLSRDVVGLPAWSAHRRTRIATGSPRAGGLCRR
jgi:hypothetical protein